MGSAVHHRIEKPCQTIRERPSLNEKITAMTTGRMDQSRYAIVMPCRTRGFRHGFLKSVGAGGRNQTQRRAHAPRSEARLVSRR